MPKVTVILTSFNHEKYIREAVDSVLNQTFGDFELFIWDDASKDGSWEIVRGYADPRIKAFRNDVSKRGIYGINKTITELASGQYIAIHHSDDVWETDKLEKQVAYLDAHPETGAVFSNALAIGEDSAPLTDKQHFYSDVFDQPNRSRHQWLRHFFFSGNALCHPSVLMRKACYDECGVYRFGLAQLPDFDMWVRLCLRYELHVLPDKLVRFRVRANEANSSGSRPDVRIRDRNEFKYILKHYARIDSFDELAAIFPEMEKYRRSGGGVPGFVFAMAALDDRAFPWAKMLGMETLFDLIGEVESRKKIEDLYQFTYRDLVAITGKHDVFGAETAANLGREIAKRNDIINDLIAQVEQLNRQPSIGGVPGKSSSGRQPSVGTPSDKEDYQKAAQALESGEARQGLALLQALAEKGSTCWEVYNDLGVQYFNQDDIARAAACFEQGMALEGDAGTTARNCASMLLAAGESDAALVLWGRILRERPDDGEVMETVRQVLSNVNAISEETWKHLVADLRGGVEISGMPRQRGGTEETSRRPEGVLGSDIRIFQIYYDEKTKAAIDPAFIPLDNLSNPRPDWAEYWPIRQVLMNQTFDDDTYLGFFSPKFGEKTGMSGAQVLEVVKQGDDEVISFSPYFEQGAICNNPFEQGELNHSGLIDTGQDVLKMLGVEMDLRSIVCDQTTMIFSNYFVARYSFWKKWFAHVQKVFEVCEGPDCELKAKLLATTFYRQGTNYSMKIFILERMVTIVMEELGIRSRIGIEFAKAPMLLPGSRENLIGLLVADALKGQYRRTGSPVYLEALLKVRGA